MAKHRARYYIVKAKTREELIQKVDVRLEAGWYPTGGLVVFKNDTEYYYLQAMIWEK
jgi:hypothetical protein